MDNKEEKSKKEILEDFIVNNLELEKLEEIIDKFNIFTALDIINYEIRHSTFLSWLMDPTENHGLKDYFLKIFLKKVALKASSLEIEGVTVFDIDAWDLDDVEVLKEWKNVDIIIKYDKQKFVCVIENKIYSKEHSNQLQRYKEITKKEFPSYKKLFVYLTAEGDIPSESDYIPLSYSEIASLIEHLIKNKEDKISSEILTFISHYNDMLRRYIMKDSEVQELCKKIYQKHKKALDLIFEYKPDKLLEIHEILIEIIKNDSDMIMDDSSKSYIRFIPKSLDFMPKKGEGWTKSKRILLFEFQNYKEGLSLNLIIGPGAKEVREKLYNKAQENTSLFNKSKRKLTPQWFTIYKKSFLKTKDSEDKDVEEIKKTLEKRFEEFKKTDLPKIEKKIKELKTQIKENDVHDVYV